MVLDLSHCPHAGTARSPAVLAMLPTGQHLPLQGRCPLESIPSPGAVGEGCTLCSNLQAKPREVPATTAGSRPRAARGGGKTTPWLTRFYFLSKLRC